MANTIQVTGRLINPLNTGVKYGEIRIRCLENSALMPMTSVSKVKTANDGSYDFELVYGKYSIEVVNSNKFNEVEHIEVTASITSPITLSQLMIDAKIPCPPANTP